MKIFKKPFLIGQTETLDFLPPLLRLQDTPPSPIGRKVLWAILGLIGILLLWALIGKLDIVAVAEGKLVPHSYVKIVQPAEAGIVKEILTREGASVKAGDVLMRMDALITEADATALEAELARKRMGLAGSMPSFPESCSESSPVPRQSWSGKSRPSIVPIAMHWRRLWPRSAPVLSRQDRIFRRLSR